MQNSVSFQFDTYETMDLMYKSIAVLCVVIVLYWTWKVLNWVWFRPKTLEKLFKEQGLKGNSYNILFGDLKKMSTMMKQVKSKPINLSTDTVPRVIPWIHDSVENYGKNSFMWIGTVPRVNIMDLEQVKEVLHKHEIFRKPNANPVIKKCMDGLSTHDGEKWAKHRKIINPAFHVEKLKLMVPAIYLSCSELISNWEKMVFTNGSCELDVWPYLETLTSDVISRTAFGSSFEEGRKIIQDQKEQIELLLQASLFVRFPGSRFLPTKSNKRMNKIYNEVKLLVHGIIDKKMAALKEGATISDDLLSILLESNMKEIQNGNISLGMSLNDVVEECKLFYMAGQETTSSLLVWTLILLSMNPNWQVKAREEVEQIFGNKEPDVDGLNRLKIVTMIFYEVLRLYPSVPYLNRVVYKDATLGDISLPAGVQLSIPLILIHHDYDIWGVDAKEFKPERFSQGISNATKDKFSLLSFSLGPRICIGQNFAMLEAKMALSMILQKFSFELSTSYTHAPTSLVTLHPQYGAQVILHKIKYQKGK